MGDMIETGGFRGRVLEIGIRSTKLLGQGNEIKTINNSSIGNVLNLSKRTSFCSVSFVIKSTDSLEEIESMLARELPAYKDRIPGIISGPKYAGVAKVEDGKTTLEISAEAREEDLYFVKRGLNRMLQSMYEQGLIDTIKSTTRTTVSFAEGEAGALRTNPAGEEHKTAREES